jgi:hypothetical protein
MKLSGKFTIFVFVLVFQFALNASSLARTWHVSVDGTGDVPTIQAAIDTAAVGDTVLVGPGRYTWMNQGTGDHRGFIRFLRANNGFVFRSAAGPEATILDAEYQSRTLYLQGMNNLTIEGFTVTRGEAPDYGDRLGGGLLTHISNDVVRNCIFTGNRAEVGAGLNISGGGSSTLIENCTITGNVSSNVGGGIGFTASLSVGSVMTGCTITSNQAENEGGGIIVYANIVTIEDCVIAGNHAGQAGGGIGGVQCLMPSVIQRCTIAENTAPGGAGINFRNSSVLTLDYCIIAYNNGKGLDFDTGNTIHVGCNDFFGNTGGDALPSGAIDSGGNIFIDPQFCGARGSGNFYLQSDSPCLPESHPAPWIACEKIGAFSAGCGASATQQKSWGEIKSLMSK